MIDTRLRHPHGLGNVVHRHRIEAFVADDFRGGVIDFRPTILLAYFDQPLLWFHRLSL
jgi:hypothetical protein